MLNVIGPTGFPQQTLLPLVTRIFLPSIGEILIPDTTEYFGFISAAQLLPPDNGGGNNGGGTPVPEPASILLLLAGLAVLCVSRRSTSSPASAAGA